MDEQSFRERAAAEGYAEPRLVEWTGGTVNDTHVHDFGATILVQSGEMTVTMADRTVSCRAGDSFALDAGVPHAEHVGPDGVRFLAARR